ncbi:hypothetical protein FHT08_002697 [Xanthomonas campestris]|nr:hypothetical protein [Xanthomonas sp. CFBP 8151]
MLIESVTEFSRVFERDHGSTAQRHARLTCLSVLANLIPNN